MAESFGKSLYPCELCKATDFEKLYRVGMYSRKHEVVICRKCGLICLNPRWDEDENKKYYESRYYCEPPRKRVIDDKYMHDDSRENQIWQGVKDNVGEMDPIVEVGAGNGSNLFYLYQKGFKKLSCIEVDKLYCQTMNQHNSDISVYNGTLNEFASNKKENKFKLVILSHVLEHFVYPGQALRVIYDLLDADGYLYLLVPNIFYFKRPYFAFTVPHTHYYSSLTLKCILESAGFEIIKEPPHKEDEIAVLAKKSKNRKTAPETSHRDYRSIRLLLKKKYGPAEALRTAICATIECLLTEKTFNLIRASVQK